jgi:hypothetical protein
VSKDLTVQVCCLAQIKLGCLQLKKKLLDSCNGTFAFTVAKGFSIANFPKEMLHGHDKLLKLKKANTLVQEVLSSIID